MALNNVPLTGQSLNQTRDPINQNFSVIDTAFSVNHVAYNDGSGNQGKHNLVDLTVQGSVPAFGANETGLYGKVPAAPFPLTLVTETFLHRQNSSGSKDWPISASFLSVTPAPNPALTPQVWGYLPCGFLFFMGTNNLINGLNTVTYLTGASVPTFNGVLYVGISTIDSNPGNSAIQTYAKLKEYRTTTANFTFYGYNATLSSGISFIAIGY